MLVLYMVVCCVLCLLQDRLQSSLQGLLQDAGVQVWLWQLLMAGGGQQHIGVFVCSSVVQSSFWVSWSGASTASSTDCH